MHHLIYLSSATELFDKAQLAELLSQSRQNNEQAGITGVLVYKDGTFLQRKPPSKKSSAASRKIPATAAS